MRMLGNILWVFFGGLILAILWILVGLICLITVIGIPFGIQCFKFASFVLWPFGKEIVYSNRTGSFLLNILWIVLFGWEITFISLSIGVLLCMTIIGIPFGIQCFKFAKLSFIPFGAEIVERLFNNDYK